jgi:uncharacterized protein YndB with AHSA1/START domain
MTAAVAGAVRQDVTVQAPIERAFAVFADQITSWWPASHHIGAQPMEVVVIEPREGGRFFERDVEGNECTWGHVLAYEPPQRLLLSWGLQGDWSYDPDPARASEIEVTFTAEGPTTTRVVLEHRKFEAHGEDAQGIRDAVGSDGGWGSMLKTYAEVAER